MDSQELQSLLKWVRAATVLLGLLILSLWVSIGVAVVKTMDAKRMVIKQSDVVLKEVQSQKTTLAHRLLAQADETLVLMEGFDVRRKSLREIPSNPLAKADLSIRLAQLLGDEVHQTVVHMLKTQRALGQELLPVRPPSKE